MSPHALIGQMGVAQVSVGQMGVGQMSRILILDMACSLYTPVYKLIKQTSP